MPDITNNLLINFMDTPVLVDYGTFGEAFIEFPGGAIVKLDGFRKFSIGIETTKASSCQVAIGKLSNTTFGQAFDLPLDSKIHTFDVIGPEMSLLLRGTQNTTEAVRLWVYFML